MLFAGIDKKGKQKMEVIVMRREAEAFLAVPIDGELG